MKNFIMKTITAAIILFFFPVLFHPSFAGSPETGVSHLFGKSKVEIVPDRFLRGYDPITVFFPSPEGPQMEAHLDYPEGILDIEPDHPGEYKWLDAETLQFLPTVSWPALEKYDINIKGKHFNLYTLMDTPIKMSPSDDTENLPPFREITLTFENRIEEKRLAEMISFEVRPLPGTEGETEYQLTDNDFSVKEIEPASMNDDIDYQITLHKSVPRGGTLMMHLRLSLDDRIKGTLAGYSFSTRPAFNLKGIGSNGAIYPVAKKGGIYTKNQAIECSRIEDPIILRFNQPPASVSLNTVKKMVKFSPPVERLRVSTSGNDLRIYFDKKRNRTYRADVEYRPITSKEGEQLSEFGKSVIYFYYKKPESHIRWASNEGILERYGPQVFPMEGSNVEQLDLRIYKINPLNRNFWPFPERVLEMNDESRPKGPGEEPKYGTNIKEQIKLIGSPLISKVVPLPSPLENGRAKFGINLENHLAEISGAGRPGTYLIGFRRIGKSDQRDYVRVQVTDLCLSTIEDDRSVIFIVTSLKTGGPVPGASVSIHGTEGNTGYISGTTNSEGIFEYRHRSRIKNTVKRIVVKKGEDYLVLDAADPPPAFLNNHWYGSNSTGWLSWLTGNPRNYKSRPVQKAHIYTERPIYRPEEPVHIKGYVRTGKSGRIHTPEGTSRKLTVNGPGRKEWNYSVDLNPYGGFYHKFDKENPPTGEYSASIIDEHGREILATVYFKKESYRIPRFEINMIGPGKVGIDEDFTVRMIASYYAGGRVVGQPAEWRATRFPYHFDVKDYPGFLFSSDERFSSGDYVDSGSVTTSKDVTDEKGSSEITIDPTRDKKAGPRRYVFEATVRGADEQTVTNSTSVLALPSFMLGLKLERFVKDGKMITPQVVVVGPDQKPIEGKEFHLRLLHRQWHSYLQESDFTTGKAQYVTDVVDKTVFEKDYLSERDIKDIRLETGDAGVYIVEISARDKLGRLQKVKADLYVAGDTPVSWEKTKANVFKTSLDKSSYIPGETARLIIRSPFQRARAFTVIERPTENEYLWVDIRNGQGIIDVYVEDTIHPSLPIHTVLMRGRPRGSGDDLKQGGEDRGKPVTMANTTWLNIEPRSNRLDVDMVFPEKNLPGSEMEMEIRLTDPDGRPMSGEVVLWLVDRAVLALGKEKSIDPLPSFVDSYGGHLRISDTRNSAVGNPAVEEMPGGGEGMEAYESEADLLEKKKVTVRKNFKTVPYYNPSIEVRDGYGSVKIQLPDNITEFAVRAVATDGGPRFGFAKSKLLIRLPLIVQPALPRFVRPGDDFKAGGIGRVVEGEVGPGLVQMRADGLNMKGEETRSVVWVKDKAERLYYSLEVPGDSSKHEVEVTMAVERTADGAADAFSVKLPVRRDRDIRVADKFENLEPGKSTAFPEPEINPRPGTLEKTAVVSTEDALIKMLTGLNFLAEYPYGCTEQRISKLMPELALKEILSKIGMGDRMAASDEYMEETLRYLETTIKPNGLCGYWPGSRGYVSLTAYVTEFLYKAGQQGYGINEDLLQKSIKALEASLRSDYSHFIDGYSFTERTEALRALSEVGRFDEKYAYNLFTRALNMNLYSEANILYTYLENAGGTKKQIDVLSEDIRKSLVYKLRDGERVYHGLQYRARSWGGLIHASEVKTLSAVARALYKAEPGNKKTRVLFDELISRGREDGWGSTNANAMALLALGELLKERETTDAEFSVEITGSEGSKTLESGMNPVIEYSASGGEAESLKLISTGTGEKGPLAWLRIEYAPNGLGNTVESYNNGFVVECELLEILGDEKPPLKHEVEAGETITLDMGTVIEEHVTVINPEDRYYVAVNVPFAAGFEPLNPNLETSPPEAVPEGDLTLPADYSDYADDAVTFYYDTLPKGQYEFFFRLRTSFEGKFIHPPAKAEMMYRMKTKGTSDGMTVVVEGRPEETAVQ